MRASSQLILQSTNCSLRDSQDDIISLMSPCTLRVHKKMKIPKLNNSKFENGNLFSMTFSHKRRERNDAEYDTLVRNSQSGLAAWNRVEARISLSPRTWRYTYGVVLSSACTRRMIPLGAATGRDTNVNVSVNASGRRVRLNVRNRHAARVKAYDTHGPRAIIHRYNDYSDDGARETPVLSSFLFLRLHAR